MNYSEAQNKVFAHGTVPDGYFGDRASVGFAFMDGYTICVHAHGCHNSGLPKAIDEREALWLLQHHPAASNITITSVGRE